MPRNPYIPPASPLKGTARAPFLSQPVAVIPFRGALVPPAARLFTNAWKMAWILALGLPTLASGAELDLRSDAVAALGTRAEMRSHAVACEKIAGPANNGWVVRWAEHFWEGGNTAAFRYADFFSGSLAPDDRSSFQSDVDAYALRAGALRKLSSTVSVGSVDMPACQDLLTRLSDYEHRHDLMGRDVARRLETAYVAKQGGNETVRVEVRHEDMVIGCMKSAAKHGQRDLEHVRSQCECTMGAMESSATPAQIDAYTVSAASADKAMLQAQLLKQPWMQAAIPKMQACLAKAP